MRVQCIVETDDMWQASDGEIRKPGVRAPERGRIYTVKKTVRDQDGSFYRLAGIPDALFPTEAFRRTNENEQR